MFIGMFWAIYVWAARTFSYTVIHGILYLLLFSFICLLFVLILPYLYFQCFSLICLYFLLLATCSAVPSSIGNGRTSRRRWSSRGNQWEEQILQKTYTIIFNPLAITMSWWQWFTRSFHMLFTFENFTGAERAMNQMAHDWISVWWRKPLSFCYIQKLLRKTVIPNKCCSLTEASLFWDRFHWWLGQVIAMDASASGACTTCMQLCKAKNPSWTKENFNVEQEPNLKTTRDF